MPKVKNIIPPMLQQISIDRPWIFIVYSGDDHILDHIASFERLDNGLSTVISTPFTVLKNMHYCIVDIEGNEHFKIIKKRFLMKEIINIALTGDHEKITTLEDRIKRVNDNEVSQLLSLYYYDWGNALSDLAKQKEDNNTFEETYSKMLRVAELGGSVYSLACLYALQNKKYEALKYLEVSLENKDISVDFVHLDEGFILLKDDKEFLSLLVKYK